MSLAPGEQQRLTEIERQLRNSDPWLGAAFARFAAEEGQDRPLLSCQQGSPPERRGPAQTIILVGRRILEKMKPARAATRRFLPTSPFKPPPPAPPAEQFAPQDQVTHDTYGLGRVISVEDDTAVVVDFGTQRVRIATPCAKLSKL